MIRWSMLSNLISINPREYAEALDYRMRDLLIEILYRFIATQPDYAGIHFDENTDVQAIEEQDVYHLITDWDSNGPETISDADHANNQLVFGDSRVYTITLSVDSDVVGAAQTGCFRVFAISQTTTNITGITRANPGVVTAAAHGLSNGDFVKITGVAGMTEVNDKIFKVASKADNTFELTDYADGNINTGGYGAWTSGGTVALATDTDVHFDQKYSNGAQQCGSASFHFSATAGDACEVYFRNETSSNNIVHECGHLIITGV